LRNYALKIPIEPLTLVGDGMALRADGHQWTLMARLRIRQHVMHLTPDADVFEKFLRR